MAKIVVRKKVPERNEDIILVAPVVPNNVTEDIEIIIEKKMTPEDYIKCTAKKIMENVCLENPFTENRIQINDFPVVWHKKSSKELAAEEDEPLAYYLGKNSAYFSIKTPRTINIPCGRGCYTTHNLKLPFSKKCIGNELDIHVMCFDEEITDKTLQNIISDLGDSEENYKIVALASEKGYNITNKLWCPNTMFSIVNLEKNQMIMDERFKTTYYDDIFYPSEKQLVRTLTWAKMDPKGKILYVG